MGKWRAWVFGGLVEELPILIAAQIKNLKQHQNFSCRRVGTNVCTRLHEPLGHGLIRDGNRPGLLEGRDFEGAIDYFQKMAAKKTQWTTKENRSHEGAICYYEKIAAKKAQSLYDLRVGLRLRFHQHNLDNAAPSSGHISDHCPTRASECELAWNKYLFQALNNNNIWQYAPA